jgi:integrase
MTWEPSKARWRKMYKGKVHTISCATLGCPPSKVASYKAANDWWVAKRAEIDGRTPVPIHPHDSVMRQISDRLAWAQGHGRADIARACRMNLEMLEGDRENDLGASIAYTLLGGQESQSVWEERLSQSKESPVPADRTIAGQVSRWVELQKARASAGEIVPAEAENRRHAIAYFETWVGRDLTLDTIDERKWTDYYTHLLGLLGEGRRSRSYAAKLLRYARQFLEWLDSEGLVSVPRNLNKTKIKQQVREVQIMPVDEVRRLISTATGPLRLHLLLMANCGFTQQDISDLHPREFRDGCIVRKRSKTRDHKAVPEVRYRLWPETLALLEEHRSDDHEHLLVTKSGQAWVRKEFKEGKFIETDSIRTLYSRHARAIDVKMSMKYIRKTSATLIDRETKRFDDRIATLFLGHSPRSIKDRHYSRPAGDVLDEALSWLRDQYFPSVVVPPMSSSQ